MEEPRFSPSDNGFQSRDLGSRLSVHAERILPLRRIRHNEGPWRQRAYDIYEWMKRRGRKQLQRDAIKILVGLAVLYTAYLYITLPDISDPRSLIASQSSVIVDRNGTELYRLYNEEDRTFVDQNQIPESMRQAIVAIEDERFYDRGCLDIRAIARAVFSFGQGGGASTLTRQLARNALDLKRENILNRKLKEIVLGCQLESRYSKDELLNLYLNWIPFGQNAYGIEQASQKYFGMSASDLTLAQSAILAALPQAPTYYSPYGKHVRTTVSADAVDDIASGRVTNTSKIPDEEIQTGLLGNMVGTGARLLYIGGRTDQVLKNMEELEFITEAQRLSTLKELETMTFEPNRENIRAAHFVLWVKAQVEELLGDGADAGVLNQGGLTIETTLDWTMQQEAEKLIAAKREDIASVYTAHNIALVSVKTGTNEIMAYVGNSDYNDEEHDGKVDMARAPRQPGSSFKPFVYATAFTKGYGPGTILYDVPTKFGTDQPQNFDATFWGITTVRRALGGSRNIPAIKAFFLAGQEDAILDVAAAMGVETPQTQKRASIADNPDFQYGWPLALGAGEAPLTEMVRGYATFADGGTSTPLTSIRKITDRRGNILFEANAEREGTQAIDPRVAYEITSVLSDVRARPNEFWQNVLSVPGFQAAAKTGTSNKCLDRGETGGCTERRPSDLWTLGYTPNLVTGVWIGNADASPLAAKAESLSLAAPIWKDFMVRAHKTLKNPVTSFTVPSGIVQPQISTLSGQLPTECTPVDRRVSDVFLQENAPSKDDPACVQLTVDKVTGLLASDECPAEAAEERSFFAPQPEFPSRFPQWQTAVTEWVKSKMAGYDPVTNTFAGSGGGLPLPLAPTEECRLSLTPGRTAKPEVRIDYPHHNGTASYPSFQPRIDVSVGSKVREVRFELDGKPVGSVLEAPFTAAIEVPRSVKEDGEHVLQVTLIDEYYNEATDQVTFRFEEDRSNPSVEFTSPRGDLTAKSGETLVLQVDAEDDEGGIKYVEFFVDDRLLTTKPQAPYRLDWKQDLKQGTYTLKAVATDLAGNEASDEVELRIEN